MNGEENTITVFVVARSAITRAGLETVLSNDADIKVIGGAWEISRVPSVFAGGQMPETILINLEAAKDFDDLIGFLSDVEIDGTDFPQVIALFPAELQTSEYLTKAFQNNLGAALTNNASTDELTNAIKAAARNLTVLPNEFMEILLSSGDAFLPPNYNTPIENQDSENRIIENLTTRETEVLELLVEGESNKRIANLLNISEHTVKFHIASIFGKLGATTRTEAAMIAVRGGLIFL